MESINSNLSSLMQLNQSGSVINLNNVFNAVPVSGNFMQNDIAFALAPDISGKFENFDAVMGNVYTFMEVIDTSRFGISQMFSQGESIRSLLEKAKEEGLTPESLQAIQDEVDARIADIQNIRQNTRYNEINPFDGAITLNIPNWQDVTGAEKTDDEESELAEVLASFKIDMSMVGDSNGSGFNIGASATIEIGYTKDGALQITVDASMDFDLSGIQKNGIQSDESMDIINQFLNLLTGKGNDLGTAYNMLDNFMASGSASIIGNGFGIEATNDINIDNTSSEALKGQIVQHAKITLDSTANQSPSIAINLL